MPSSPSRQVYACLTDSPVARELAQRAARTIALQGDLARLSPIPGLTVLGLDGDGVLRVATPSAAAAAKLRQFEPRLVAGLAARGWAVTRLRARTQPVGDLPPVPMASPRGPIPPAALSSLAELAGQTPEGPLKAALAALLRHAR
ncbi:MAG: DUF721 domain-containing protein [Betaproteobacteria bacterium]|nr:DUF721 domain-containing protein [Betaproteobacteria bacterium]